MESCLFVDCQTLLVRGDVISRVTGLLHYKTWQSITLLNVYAHGDINSWVSVTNEIQEHWSPTNNDDSTVINPVKRVK